MWSAITIFVLGIVKWFFGQRQQTEGEAQGKAEQKADDLSTVVTADRAQTKVSNEIDTAVSGDSDGALDSGLREFEAGSSAVTRH